MIAPTKPEIWKAQEEQYAGGGGPVTKIVTYDDQLYAVRYSRPCEHDHVAVNYPAHDEPAQTFTLQNLLTGFIFPKCSLLTKNGDQRRK